MSDKPAAPSVQESRNLQPRPESVKDFAASALAHLEHYAGILGSLGETPDDEIVAAIADLRKSRHGPRLNGLITRLRETTAYKYFPVELDELIASQEEK